ncbi:MAG: hypothetical protein GEU82_10680 [Luteitalea sp.]|nr:hypothetical protein [Luteitalea sp.]
MPSRASRQKSKPDARDFTAVARRVVEQAIGERLDGSPLPPEPPDTRNPAAVALSKLGASKGGQTRAKNLSKARRLEIAKKAAKARWRS